MTETPLERMHDWGAPQKAVEALRVRFSDGRLRVSFKAGLTPPLMALVPMARSATTQKEGKHWACPLLDAEIIVEWADRHGYTVADDVRDYAEGIWAQEASGISLATATALPPGETPTPVTGLVTALLKPQEVVVKAASRARVNLLGPAKPHRALIVADEPGLGKSIEALASLRITGQETSRAIIICPTSLTTNWQNEMAQHFAPDTFHPWVASGRTTQPVPADIDTVVIGWDVLQDWEEELIRWKPDAVAADEGHYAKAGRQRKIEKVKVSRDASGAPRRDPEGNLMMTEEIKAVAGSARSSAALNIGAAVARNGGLVMALTGTPLVNRPVELEPLIEFVGIIGLFGGSTAFKDRFCGPEPIKGTQKIDYNGSSNLLELNSRLISTGNYIRRTKQLLIDAGLLSKKYVDGVYIYDYDSRPNPWMIHATDEEMTDYRHAEEDLESFLAERAREIARNNGMDANSDRVRRRIAGESLRHLQKIAVLRQLAAQIKAPYVLNKVRQVVAGGERVVIAAHHRAIVDLYADAFTGLKIQGDMGPKEVEQVKHLFNTSTVEEHPVLVLSVEAGKTGHTLCKQALNGVGPSCGFMVFAEQVWTPGDETQAQDRIWRIGQEREVRIINALLDNTIDLAMFRQRLRKRAVVNAAVDAIDPRIEKEGVGTILWSLAQRGMGVGSV